MKITLKIVIALLAINVFIYSCQKGGLLNQGNPIQKINTTSNTGNGSNKHTYRAPDLIIDSICSNVLIYGGGCGGGHYPYDYRYKVYIEPTAWSYFGSSIYVNVINSSGTVVYSHQMSSRVQLIEYYATCAAQTSFVVIASYGNALTSLTYNGSNCTYSSYAPSTTGAVSNLFCSFSCSL